jgi:hypothetical protein
MILSHAKFEQITNSHAAPYRRQSATVRLGLSCDHIVCGSLPVQRIAEPRGHVDCCMLTEAVTEC